MQQDKQDKARATVVRMQEYTNMLEDVTRELPTAQKFPLVNVISKTKKSSYLERNKKISRTEPNNFLPIIFVIRVTVRALH